MKRCCNGLGFEGEFSVECSRAAGSPIVHVAIESPSDLDRLASLTASELMPMPPWKAQAEFDLTEDLHDRLLKYARPPDQRGAGRRAHERQIKDREERSLRWEVNSWRD